MKDDLFLKPEQIYELSGYRLGSYQIRWLQKNGIRHYVRADGRPMVPVAAFEREEFKARPRAEPNFEALKELQSNRRRPK